MYDEQEVKEALASIGMIKKTLQGNTKMLREVFDCPGFISLSIGMGCFSLVAFGLLALLNSRFGSFGDAPLGYRMGSLLVLVLGFVAIGWWKMAIIQKHIRSRFDQTSIWTIMRSCEFQGMAWDELLIILGGTALGCILCARLDAWHLMLPISFFLMGCIAMYVAGSLLLWEYRVFGVLCMVAALVIAVFMKGSYLWWTAISICLLFWSIALIFTLALQRGNGKRT